MIILTDENSKRELAKIPKWYVGHNGVCMKCSTSFIVEAGDQPEYTDYDREFDRSEAVFICPGSYSDGEKCNNRVPIYSN